MGRLKTLDDWLKYQENLHPKKIDLGLSRVQKVYKKLFPKGLSFKVITVAGTNGKGSTIAFIHSIYQQANIKVAKFSSPHIIKYNERFVIGDKLADDGQICRAFEQIEQARADVSLSYFEFSTLAALLIFDAENVAVALLEVGLGGRLDSVNIVAHDVCVITNIAIDHSEYLGNTREAIAFEKSGIMRRNKPCICTDTNPPASIQQYADSIAAKLEFIDQPYNGEIGLLGAHQQQNAAAAIAAVNALKTNLPIKLTDIKIGIKNTKIDARLQIKAIGNQTWVFDAAHNPAAVAVLASELAKDKCLTLAIFSVMQDKDARLMIDTIRPIINKWLLVPLNNQRGMQAKELSNQFELSDNIEVCEDAQKSLKIALNKQNYSRIIVFGSFYLIADIIKAIKALN